MARSSSSDLSLSSKKSALHQNLAVPTPCTGYDTHRYTKPSEKGETNMKINIRSFNYSAHNRALWLIALGCLMLLALGSALVLAQSQSQGQQSKETKGAAPGGFPDLIAGLKATPGCLGVETAMTASKKQVIFAWFEDKKAVLKWYYS